MAKEANTYSTTEFPLVTEKYMEDNLDKRFEHARRIYNQMLSKMLKRYHEMIKTKKWRQLQDIIREELSNTESIDGKKQKSKRLNAAYAEKKDILRANGFTEFGFLSEIKNHAAYFCKTISSEVAAYTIAKPMWIAFQTLLYGNGDEVHFKKVNTQNSLTSANKSGIKFIQKDGKYVVVLSNVKANAKKIVIPVKVKESYYNTEMLKANIKICRIVRKREKSKYHYYVQLILDRPPVKKLNADGSEKHPIGKGVAGIAIYHNLICVVAKDKVLVRPLFETNDFEEKKAEYDRQLEHLRRVNNPDNFNEDGTIKNGILLPDGRIQPLTWVYSNHYKNIREKKRELERIERVNRRIYRHKLKNEILSIADHFVMQDMSFITKKPVFNENTKTSDIEYKKKKDKRKSVQNGAPAELLSIINQRLSAEGLCIIEKVSLPENLYWYRHDLDLSGKEFYDGRTVSIGGHLIDHTAYRAFLMSNYDTEHKTYKKEECDKYFDSFLEAYKKEITP